MYERNFKNPCHSARFPKNSTTTLDDLTRVYLDCSSNLIVSTTERRQRIVIATHRGTSTIRSDDASLSPYEVSLDLSSIRPCRLGLGEHRE